MFDFLTSSKILLIQYHEKIFLKSQEVLEKNNDVLQISTTNFNNIENLSEFLFSNFSEEISNQILVLPIWEGYQHEGTFKRRVKELY